MKRFTILLATAALGLVFALSASPADKSVRFAGVNSSSSWTVERLAGPWYTPTELKALVAYANASPVERRRVIASAGAPSHP
jgi:hypothetical protein